MSLRLEKQVLIVNKMGLHARPATQLAQLAGKYDAEISLQQGDKSTSATSVLGLMLLESHQGKEVTVVAQGSEAQEALDAITSLISDKFHEAE